MMASGVLVTGSSGFVGRRLVNRLVAEHVEHIVAVSRSARNLFGWPVRELQVNQLDGSTQWGQEFGEVDVVIHLAARVHVMKDLSIDPTGEYRRVNVDGTLNLARQAARSGVRRFIFISTIGVNGAESLHGAFRAEDQPAPHSAYAQTKYDAELALRTLSAETGMEIVIIRPPLVYGPNAPGNFGSLMRWMRRGVPLPLAAVDNRRSLIGLDNLVDFIVLCIHHPAAANQIFLVSDGEDVSTPELIRRMAQAMEHTPRMVSIPVWILKVGAVMSRRRNVFQQLCGNLQVDISKSRSLLGWRPPLSVDEGLRRAVMGERQ